MPYVPVLVTEFAPLRNPEVDAHPDRAARYKAPRYRVGLVKEVGSFWIESRYARGPGETAALARQLVEDMGADREMLYVVALDAKMKVIGINLVSLGSVTASIVHPRELFKAVLLLNPVSFVIFHNHPSGDPNPSQEDVAITKRIVAGAYLLGLNFQDHIIIGESGYVSLRELVPHVFDEPVQQS